MSERNRHGSLGQRLAALFLAQRFLFYGVLLFYNSWEVIGISKFFTGFSIGFDYPFYYRAAQRWLSGGNPFVEINALPLSLFSAVFFLKLPVTTAFHVFQAVNVVAVLGSLVWFCFRIGLTWVNTICLVLVAATFGPFYYVLGGGNVDGLMVALLMAACCVESRWGRAALLAASVWTKLYTALVVVVLAVRRRWRLFAMALLMLVIMGAPFLPVIATSAYTTNVNERVGWFKFVGNISPAAVFASILGQEHKALWQGLYLAFWGGTLFLRLADRRERTEAETITDYIPWMVAAPLLVNVYSGVLLLPVAARLVRTSQDRPLVFWEWVTVAGFVLVGIYPLAFVFNLPLSYEQYTHYVRLVAPVGAVGTTVLLLGMAGENLHLLRLKSPRKGVNSVTEEFRTRLEQLQ